MRGRNCLLSWTDDIPLSWIGLDTNPFGSREVLDEGPEVPGNEGASQDLPVILRARLFFFRATAPTNSFLFFWCGDSVVGIGARPPPRRCCRRTPERPPPPPETSPSLGLAPLQRQTRRVVERPDFHPRPLNAPWQLRKPSKPHEELVLRENSTDEVAQNWPAVGR